MAQGIAERGAGLGDFVSRICGCRRQGLLRLAPRAPAMTQDPCGDDQAGELLLRRVRLIADALHQPLRSAIGDRVAQIEKQTVALDDARDFRLGVETGRSHPMTMPYPCIRTVQHQEVVAAGTKAPFDVFPIEWVVGTGGPNIATEERGAKQSCATARAQMRARVAAAGNRRMVCVDAAIIDIPVDKA